MFPSEVVLGYWPFELHSCLGLALLLLILLYGECNFYTQFSGVSISRRRG